ncbi:MAG: rubredoxin [Chitinophagaceae bacterium]
MIRKIQTVKINFPGGLITVEELKFILAAAEKARIEEVKFGTRQQMYLFIQDNFLEDFILEIQRFKKVVEVNEELYPNIISSIVTQAIFENTGWITEKIYREILASMDFTPTLKINIVDSDQSFIPFFTGNINFITSEIRDCWFLFIRFPKTSITYKWKELVSSKDCSRIAKLVEKVILQNKTLFYEQPVIDGNILYDKVQEGEDLPHKIVEHELVISDFRLPYYEGFNQYGIKLWLGIYRRDEWFPLSFLKDLCQVCLQTRIGHVFTTPWKSIIFKDINVKSRSLWENVLGKYRINVRHASNELNWQVADLCEEGLHLKRYLIRQFDKDDVRTFGLCFAILIHVKSGLFGSVVIHKQPNNSANQRKSLDRYDILYTNKFNPNSEEYIEYRKDVLKEHLGTYLVSLCKFFYEEQINQDDSAPFEIPQHRLGQEVEK